MEHPLHERVRRVLAAGVAGLILGILLSACAFASERDVDLVWASDRHFHDDLDGFGSSTLREPQTLTDPWADPVQFQQALTPQVEAGQAVALPSAAARANAELFGAFGVPRSAASSQSVLGGGSFDTVMGGESAIRATTDVGDLLGSGAQILNLGVQRRNPIVNDPRVRGSRVGSLAASGSYWVPARLDLDTPVSKLDSRIIDSVTVVPGPYSSLYGPGHQFIDVELEPAPRYGQAFETHAATSLDYRTNGEQWYGRQSAAGGDDVWGFRMGYGHRTGSDYSSGDGLLIPSSYKSREVDAAFGAQLTPDSVVDVQGLRLDQTDVELAGQAFDIDVLTTDGYELAYALDDPAWADRLTFETWYNRTELHGSAQRPSKRKQFPFYNFIDFVGFTDVDSSSTGFRTSSQWETGADERFEAGADLRYVEQELNEITSFSRGFVNVVDANSPIPKSYSANPGLFVEASSQRSDNVLISAGGRLDYVGTKIVEDPASLNSVGTLFIPAANIYGSDDFQENEVLGLAYLAVAGETDDGWGAGAKVGYGDRAPNLTERYAIQTFMFLIQNGLNTVTGDPELEKERLLQTDLRLWRRTENFRGEIVAFNGWVRDYTTLEAMFVTRGPPNAQVEQLDLKYVNTSLATLMGCEVRAEYDWNDLLTPFATLKYVRGDDRTRDGTFATRQATANLPSEQVAGLPRGAFANTGVPPAAEEPLPGILPLESRLGLRWEERGDAMPWGVEISCRIVDDQDRIAASLLESATPGFTTWDLRTFVRPSDRLTFVAGVENFTDKQFQEHLDFRSRNPNALDTFRPGVNFYFGTELFY